MYSFFVRPRSQLDGTVTSPLPSLKTQTPKQTPSKKTQESSQPSSTTTQAVTLQNISSKRKAEAPSQTTPGKRGRKEKDKNKEKQSKDEAFAVVCALVMYDN